MLGIIDVPEKFIVLQGFTTQPAPKNPWVPTVLVLKLQSPSGTSSQKCLSAICAMKKSATLVV